MSDKTMDHEGITDRDIDRTQEIIRLRVINNKLLEALELYAPADYECDFGHVPDEDTTDRCRSCREWAKARDAIKEATE